MKNLVSVCVMVLIIFALGACSSKKRCGGGGWYGNRNLTMKVEQKAEKPAPLEQIQKVEEDCEP